MYFFSAFVVDVGKLIDQTMKVVVRIIDKEWSTTAWRLCGVT